MGRGGARREEAGRSEAERGGAGWRGVAWGAGTCIVASCRHEVTSERTPRSETRAHPERSMNVRVAASEATMCRPRSVMSHQPK